MNAEFIARSQEVWDAVERDRWIYNLDNDDGIAPNFNKNRKSRNKGKNNDVNNTPPAADVSSVFNQGNAPVINAPDNGFGSGPISADAAEESDEIPNLMDIPETELEQ